MLFAMLFALLLACQWPAHAHGCVGMHECDLRAPNLQDWYD